MMHANPLIQRLPVSAFSYLPVAKDLAVLGVQQRLVRVAHCVLAQRVEAVVRVHDGHGLWDAFFEVVEGGADYGLGWV